MLTDLSANGSTLSELERGDIREFPLGEKKIVVIDGQVPASATENFHRNCVSLSFKRAPRDLEGNGYPVFCLDFDKYSFCSFTVVGRTCGMLVRNLLSCPDAVATGVTALITFPGEKDIVLTEILRRSAADVTVYYHINREWTHRWGGETLFYEDGDTRLAVLPKPGRILLVEGAPDHLYTAPRQGCPEPKLMLAITYDLQKRPRS